MLPREVLEKVRRIEIQTRRMVTDALAGEYHSIFKGRGMEFADVYATYGSQVTILEALPRLVPIEDEEVSAQLARVFGRRGMTLKTAQGKALNVHNPLMFLAQEREIADEAFPGDVIGIDWRCELGAQWDALGARAIMEVVTAYQE